MNIVFSDGSERKLVWASHVTLRRAVGEPASWRAIVGMTPYQRGGKRIVSFAEALSKGPVEVTPTLKGGNAIGPPGTVVRVKKLPPGQAGYKAREAVTEYYEVIAHITHPKPKDNPFIPRWRVHRAKNMRDLLGCFADLVKPTTGVNNTLLEIRFPDGDNACIIQAGESDWAFALMIIRQAPLLAWLDSQKLPEWAPLTLVGSVRQNAGRGYSWIVTPGVGEVYQQQGWGSIKDRLLTLPDKVEVRPHLDCWASGTRTTDFFEGLYPVPGWYITNHTFDMDRWNNWVKKDLPLFLENGHIPLTCQYAFVAAIDDTLFEAGDGNIAWESILWPIPEGASVPMHADANGTVANVTPCIRPWFGRGQVQESSPKGPWIKVKLYGFEKGADICSVRLTTPYSGTEGKTGIHFVPERDTEVWVGWSGLFTDPVLLVHNVRAEEAGEDSPFIGLEKKLMARSVDVNIKSGDVDIDSGKVRINADRTKVTLEGGVLKTGRAM